MLHSLCLDDPQGVGVSADDGDSFPSASDRHGCSAPLLGLDLGLLEREIVGDPDEVAWRSVSL